MSEPRVLITGASAGLGEEFARQLAVQGRDLVLVARRSKPMEKLAAELHDEYNVAVDVIGADLSVEGEPGRLFAEVEKRGLVINYLVNNAGSAGPDLIRNRDWEATQRYLELMVVSYAAMCHHFIPPMRERGDGRVINVASVAGLISFAGDYSYGPTKAYLVSLSRSLSLSFRDEGVRVMALCPGFTHTDFHASEQQTKMKKGTPGFLWYDADVVVREGLAAVERGCATYTSGRLYRWTVPVLRTAAGRWMLRKFGVVRRGH